MTEWYATLRFRIILIVVISVLPALGLVLYGGLEQRRLAGLEARQEALQLARQASLNQENLITEARHLLSMIAERQAVRNGQWGECSAAGSGWRPVPAAPVSGFPCRRPRQLRIEFPRMWSTESGKGGA